MICRSKCDALPRIPKINVQMPRQRNRSRLDVPKFCQFTPLSRQKCKPSIIMTLLIGYD